MPDPRREADLSTPTARRRLQPKSNSLPYWRFIAEGRHLGYRPHRGTADLGTWCARLYVGVRSYTYTTLGTADDRAPADGDAVLTYRQALEKAQRWCDSEERKAKGLAPREPTSYTVRQCMADRSRRSMDLRDFHRYDMVTTIFDRVPVWTEEAQTLREVLAQHESPGLNEQRRKLLTQEAERFERFVKDASWTDRRIFAFAAAELAQDPWHGTVSAEAIKASYCRVKNRPKRDPKGRYYFGLLASRGIEAARRKGAAPIKGSGVADPPSRLP